MALTRAFLLQSYPWGPGHTTPHGQELGREGLPAAPQAVSAIAIVKAQVTATQARVVDMGAERKDLT